MNQENTTVDKAQVVESVQDDAVQAPAEENPNTVIALTDLIAEDAGEATEEAAQEPADETQAQEEQKPMNGGIKGRLLESEEKGRKRGYNDGYAAAKAEFEAEKAKMAERLAKLDELELQEAAKKIEQEEGCSAALAMRLARLERGLPPQTAATNTQPRDASGRFVKAEAQGQNGVDPKVQALYDQAQTVQRATGINVLDILSNNEEVQRRMNAGEIDFADVAREYGQQERKKAPPVVRTSAGSTVKARGFADLSDEAFDQMQAELSKGRMIDLRR